MTLHSKLYRASYSHSLGGDTDKSNTAWFRTLRVHISLISKCQTQLRLLGRLATKALGYMTKHENSTTN